MLNRGSCGAAEVALKGDFTAGHPCNPFQGLEVALFKNKLSVIFILLLTFKFCGTLGLKHRRHLTLLTQIFGSVTSAMIFI